MENNDDNYKKYRGKCKEFCEKLCDQDKSLRIVRGVYCCPIWGEQDHWWCISDKGLIIDPTVNQFPTKGFCATYTEFNGMVACIECGKEIKEEYSVFYGHHAFCSTSCIMRYVGL